MMAGRLRWRDGSAKAPHAKLILAEFTFQHGRLFLTEAGSTRRAAMHVIRGRAALAALDPGGIDPLAASLDAGTRVASGMPASTSAALAAGNRSGRTSARSASTSRISACLSGI